MSSLSRDKKQLVIDLDAKEAINRIGYLRQEYNKLSEERKKSNSYTTEKKLGEEMAKLSEKIKEAREEVGLQGLSLKELGRYQRELKREMDQFPDQSDQWKKVNAELTQVADRYKEVSTRAAFRAEQERLVRDEMLETVRVHGTQALTIEQLDQLQRQLYRDIQTGAASGDVANDKLTQSFREISTATNTAKQQLSRYTIAQEMEEKATIEAVQANRIQGSSLQQLKHYHEILTKQIRESAQFESQLNKQRIREAQEVKKTIDIREQKVSGTGGMLSFLKGSLPAAVAGGVAGAAVGIVNDTIASIKQKFVDAIAFMKKQARSVSEIQTILNVDRGTATKVFTDLNKINTERSRDELKQLVEVAGDINVATADVQEFVISADKLERVFARDFGGVGEAATMVAKLKDTFKETKELKVDESYAKIGSTIKVLNDEGPATTKGIVEFVSRIGQLPNAIKPAIQDTAALAAVMEEANLTAEISSGGISAILLRAGKNAEEFGQFFGMAKDEFQRFVAEDPIGFLTKFAEKVSTFDEAKLSELFAGLKIESQESIKAIGVLSNNLDKFRDKQSIANKAFTEGTRIDDIFRVFNNDENAEMTKAEKKIEVFTQKLTGWFGRLGTSLMVNFARLLPSTITETERLTEAFKLQSEKADTLERNSGTLLGRYNELITKSKRSADENIELKKVMNDISTLIPGAVTQWDNYGNAISISTDRVRENVIEQRKLAREMNAQRIESLKNDLLRTQNDIKDKKRKLDLYTQDKNDFEAGKRKWMQYPSSAKVIPKISQDLRELTEDAKAGQLELDTLLGKVSPNSAPSRGGLSRNSGQPTASEGGNGTGNIPGSSSAKSGESGLSATEQLIQDQEKLAAIVFEKNQLLLETLAKEEAALLRSKELQDVAINREIKNAKERKDALFANQQLYDLQLKQLQEKYEKERETEITEQAKTAVQLAQAEATFVKERELQLAEASKDETRIYNAKFALLEQQRANKLANETADFEKGKKELADNQDAIELLTRNHKARIRGIEFEHNNSLTALLNQQLSTSTEIAKKQAQSELQARVEAKKLDLQAAQQTPGGKVQQATIDLLNAEMMAELSVADLTETEKTNIVRKYALERQAIERAGIQAVADQAIQIYSQAFSVIQNARSQSLQNEAAAEDNNFNKTVERLEKQKETGILTEKEYQKARSGAEANHTKEVNKNRYEQAKLNKQNNISQAVINGIQAVMKGYAQAGPLGGIPLAVIMGAISAANVATIASQKLPEFYWGGSTGTGTGRLDSRGGFAAMLHPNEYVVNSTITRTPQWAVIEPMLESMRFGGNGNQRTVLESSRTDTNNVVFERINSTMENVNNTMQNLTVAYGGNDWERFHRDYTDFLKRNDANLISNT